MPSRIALAALLLIATAACSSNGATPATAVPEPANVAPALHASSVASVNLRSAEAFAILAGSTVTSVDKSEITGNVGIFPGSAMTGFPPGIIHGHLHIAGPIAQQAELDLKAAYNNAAGRTSAPVAVSGNLGGQTLYPGLYKSTSSLAVSSGDLTLDGRGSAKSIFIFAMGSSFTMTTGRRIILTHGARADNIFWAVGSSATLGTGCTFHGNLLVRQSISLATASVVGGRLLAESGAVTLQSNTIVRP